MKIVDGDLWLFPGWKIVPTNTSINRLNQAVMGRGVAQQAAIKFPGLKNTLGKAIKDTSRAPIIHLFRDLQLICLPVKRNWMDRASLSLIEGGLKSVVDLVPTIEGPIYLPLLGCGFGELEEESVLLILEKHLDDRFVLIKKDNSVVKKYPSSFIAGVRRDRSLDGSW